MHFKYIQDRATARSRCAPASAYTYYSREPGVGQDRVATVLSRVQVTNNRGVTPLMFAASGNHLAAVKVLVQHGADLSRRNYDHHTALDIARRRSNRKIVEYLSRFAAAESGQLLARH
ncbi:hypothetical protein PR048_024613 [Dryococelus australis]|uniref:Uncharacterized protein n=1 Tax=Dryococelus australis TaxID=614101 RepID=A0ABQ9GP52_9NEOP|nr:hypothetical protein PR048_024613 [Dryococelus australis]